MSEDAFELKKEPFTVELKDAANDLRNLPADHYRLAQKCVIKDDTISMVPPEIGRFENLEVLEIRSGRRIETLPPEIARCQKLRQITFFAGNVFEYFGARFCGGARPQQSFNRLPAEIGELHALEEIYFNLTNISTLPAEIGKLKNLRVLNLYGCKITNARKNAKNAGRNCPISQPELPEPLQKPAKETARGGNTASQT